MKYAGKVFFLFFILIFKYIAIPEDLQSLEAEVEIEKEKKQEKLQKAEKGQTRLGLKRQITEAKKMMRNAGNWKWNRRVYQSSDGEYVFLRTVLAESNQEMQVYFILKDNTLETRIWITLPYKAFWVKEGEIKTLDIQGRIDQGEPFKTKMILNQEGVFLFNPASVLVDSMNQDLYEAFINSHTLQISFQTSLTSSYGGKIVNIQFETQGLSELYNAAEILLRKMPPEKSYGFI